MSSASSISAENARWSSAPTAAAAAGTMSARRFALYAFDVIVVVPLTDAQRKQLRAIVEYLKPAHTHFVTLVEPAPPAFIDHWELGVSEIGVTADLH
jgi:F0F1-type ATP synthase delta subunit